MYIGVDVGTSGTKVILTDANAETLASYVAEYKLYSPRNGYAEQDALDWRNAAFKGIRAVLEQSGARGADVRAIGLSGQMHGLVPLNADGDPLRKAIIWCDQRSGAEAALLTEIFGRETLIEKTGNPAMTGFTAAKLLWFKNNEPSVFAMCKHVLLPKDYIRLCLTGGFATDISDAAGTQLMNIISGDWDSELLAGLGISREILPRIHESAEHVGTISQYAASRTGLKAGTPVVAGAADNAAAAIGCGIISEGNALTTLGSSAVIYAVSDKPRIDGQGRVHTLRASVPGKWTIMSCTQAAGMSLKWLRETFGFTETYSELDRLAAEIPVGSDRLIYLPFLNGERSPNPDPDARGVFIGLNSAHTKANVVRAVLEGVAFSQRACLDVFREIGINITDMISTGGGSKSRLWRQILADLYNCPVKALGSDDGAAMGAAVLAGARGTVRVAEVTEPSSDAARYEDFYGVYKNLYPTLKSTFAAMAKL
jgi:xylulokinase